MLATEVKRPAKRRAPIDVSKPTSAPRRTSPAVLLLVGVVFGMALTGVVYEYSGADRGVGSAPDPSVRSVASIEDALQAPNGTLTRMSVARLDWLTARSVLPDAPEYGALTVTLDAWVQIARDAVGIVGDGLALPDEAHTKARWQHILAALYAHADLRFDLTPPRPERADDQFLTAAIRTKRVTTATWPLLQLVIAERLGDHLEPIIASERLLCRVAPSTGPPIVLDLDPRGIATTDDRTLMDATHIPLHAVALRSELAALSPRQLGAWLLARRARVKRYRGDLADADRDLLEARRILPANRSLFLQMVQLLDHRGPDVLGVTAWDLYASKKKHAAAIAGMDIPKTAQDVMRFNQATRGQPTGVMNPWPPRLPQPPGNITARGP